MLWDREKNDDHTADKHLPTYLLGFASNPGAIQQ